MAVGNVIGSNIFNILWILGRSGLINSLPFDVVSNTDILMIIFASTLLILSVISGSRPRIDRWHGIVYIAIYIAYIAYLVVRG